MAKRKFYVVWKGRRTGIFDTWEACRAQVEGFPGAQYKAFPSRAAAEAAFQQQYADHAGRAATRQQWLLAPTPPVLPSLCVDAACPGIPGPVEYRGVLTESGEQVFHQGPFPDGTTNVGEFLAIVHGLAWLAEHGLDWTVYSDSRTAIAWVRKRRCNTRLKRNARNAPLFERIARAERWLAEHPNHNPVLKWDTAAWGEIPADFGRK